MPMGGQHVIVELFALERDKRGAYHLRVTEQMPEDEWEQSALRTLEDLLAVVVTGDPTATDTMAEGIACEFHTMWTTGFLMLNPIHLRATHDTVADTRGMRWVTVKQGA